MIRCLVVFIFYFAIPIKSQGYPVFGTKRYQRASSSAQMPIPASLVPNPSFYNNPPKYYYEQRPAYAVPTYHETYPDDNPYYFYPRQEYYGMPIYHGEYKPTPYYYAHPPSFNYFDDRDVGSNPLDDLHEEILQEDERERQRELVPLPEESWYEGNTGQQDELTNNFLRNLIAYNRQINAQEEQRQEQQSIDQTEPQQQHDYQNDRPSPTYDEEYGDYSSSEYEYVPEQVDSFNSRKLNTIEDKKLEKFDVDDENERQLKFLAQHPKPQVAQSKQYNPQNSHWDYQSSSTIKQRNQNKALFTEPETTPEYEDDTWINWDRKRNANSEMKMFPGQIDESIRAFSNRKPTLTIGKVSSTITPSPQPSTPSTPSTTIKLEHVNAHQGQKEVVLPRPAGVIPRGFMPSKPIDGDIQPEQNSFHEQLDANSQHDVKSNIFETIKKLMAMQEQYKNPSKLQKRSFVSNEETLVRELDNLKRRSV